MFSAPTFECPYLSYSNDFSILSWKMERQISDWGTEYPTSSIPNVVNTQRRIYPTLIRELGIGNQMPWISGVTKGPADPAVRGGGGGGGGGAPS